MWEKHWDATSAEGEIQVSDYGVYQALANANEETALPDRG